MAYLKAAAATTAAAVAGYSNSGQSSPTSPGTGMSDSLAQSLSSFKTHPLFGDLSRMVLVAETNMSPEGLLQATHCARVVSAGRVYYLIFDSEDAKVTAWDCYGSFTVLRDVDNTLCHVRFACHESLCCQLERQTSPSDLSGSAAAPAVNTSVAVAPGKRAPAVAAETMMGQRVG